MSELVQIEPFVAETPSPAVEIDPACMAIRRENFPDTIAFHAPGLKRYKTSEYEVHDAAEFVSVSVTGSHCALNCEHCNTGVLQGMPDLSRYGGSLFELCAALAEKGARGVLVSGGSDKKGRVPLLKHIPDMIRIRKELGMTIRVHPGLPDEETCAGLGEVGIDGAMVDIIGHEETIREVYHLHYGPEAYEIILANLQKYDVPTIPHIILGLHFGKMLGEWRALEMIANYPPKLLVLVILMPLSGTAMALTKPPSLEEIGEFFELTRKTMPETPVMLGCARPLGRMKYEIDRLAIAAGFNGIAYPAEGIISEAENRQLRPKLINACCGVSW